MKNISPTGKSAARKVAILLIGPLPPTIGGDTRLFSYLCDDLQQNPSLAMQTINTARGRSGSNLLVNLWVTVKVLASIIRRAASADIISFHASNRGMLSFGPLLYLLARLYRKPLILRLFGGSFDSYYQTQGKVAQWLLRHTVLAAHLSAQVATHQCLLETKQQVRFFQKISPEHVVWFSNYTRLEAVTLKKPVNTGPRTHCQRFIFLGHVKEAKGIETILACAGQLPEQVTIDIFGPLYGYTAEQINQRGEGKICYRGVLTQAQVAEQLWTYDALLLPTFHLSEGYPGVIIEAFSHEMPVITTRWRAIPEIVDERCGILIEPHNSQQLAEAIVRLHGDPQFYRVLCAGAQRQAQQFSDTYWTQEFMRICQAALAQINPLSAIEA